MHIHENKKNTYRSKSTCGYCRTEGHNQYQCPHVKGDWENFLSKWKIPVDNNDTPIKRGYNCIVGFYGNSRQLDPLTANVYNNGFTSWFRNCRKAYIKQKERGFKLDYKPNRSKSSKPKKCGFCGGQGHTRRDCDVKKQFLKDCYKANENWRMVAYQEIVQKHGLSVGAVVEVSDYKWSPKGSKRVNKIGIIKSINWDTINVFSAMEKVSSSAHSPLKIGILVEGKTRPITNLHNFFDCIGRNGDSHRGSSLELVRVVTHSPTPLDASWVTSYKESFETLAKKRSFEQLRDGMMSEWSSPNLINHVQTWKNNLTNF